VGLVTVGLWIKEGWVLREPLLCRCPRAASHKEWCTGEFEGRYHTFVLYETYAKGSVVLYGKLPLDFYLALQQARIHISLFGKWKETYPTGGYASFLNIPSPYKYFNPCLEQQ
jgi:hypothetical protein